MEKKLRLLFEVGFVILLTVYYFVKVMIPEYREKYGSSDMFLRTKNYQNLYEIKIDRSVHFAFVLNDKNQIYHILFLNRDAKVLYNRNIENHSIEDALHKTISVLVDRKYLKDDSIITITRYEESGYSNFSSCFSNELKSYNIHSNVIEKKRSLEQLARELSIEGDSNQEILRNLDLYSKEVVGFLMEENNQENLDYSKAVYQKLSNYIQEKSVDSFDKNHVPFPIQMIPANEEETLFPTSNSWYSYQDEKLVAYIELSNHNNDTGYCFQGSVDSYKKGEC